MRVIIEPTEARLNELRRKYHTGCVACGESDPLGLQVEWGVSQLWDVEGRFYCSPALRSYDGQLHGGVIALILDCAMTNCLFSHGLAGLTLDMAVRFLHPLPVERRAVFHASLQENSGPRFRLRSEITLNDKTIASATAKFVERGAALAMRNLFS